MKVLGNNRSACRRLSRNLPTAAWSVVLPLLLIGLATVVGCSGSNTAKISGQVTLNGQPLETGAITFVPADGKGASGGGVIEAGRYSVDVPPGAKRVEIRGFKYVGMRPNNPRDPNSPLVKMNEPIVPAKYNADSKLQYEVNGPADDADFALTVP